MGAPVCMADAVVLAAPAAHVAYRYITNRQRQKMERGRGGRNPILLGY